jgi:hypothetical protein
MSESNTTVSTVEGESSWKKFFSQMSESQMCEVWDSCFEEGVITEQRTDALKPDCEVMCELLEGKEHVDVVVACSNVQDKNILEILMSRPLTVAGPTSRGSQSVPHTRPNGSKSTGPRTPRAPTVPGEKPVTARGATMDEDPHVISFVKPNPKKPSSAAHGRYALYVVGMSIAEFIRAGGTKADVLYDMSKGFIVAVDQKEWAASQEPKEG